MTADRTKNPSSIVYWNDLEDDEHLKTCSWGARGLWACKLLPIAARSAEYGVILIGDHPCQWDVDLPTVLAKAAGAGTPDVVALVAASFLTMLTELITSRAASVDDRGRIYNRRMVREEQIRRARSAAGKAGMERRWRKGADNKPITNTLTNGITNAEGEERDQVIEGTGGISASRQDGGYRVDNKTIASSLLHDSKTLSTTESVTASARSTRAEAAERATRLPDGWKPEGALREWTISTIRDAGSQVSAGHELEKFRDYWRAQPGAKGRKLDWDATWRNWIREAIRREGKPNGTRAHNQKPCDTAIGRKARFAAALRGLGDRGPADDGGGN